MWLVIGPQGPEPLWSQDQDYTLTPTPTPLLPWLRPGVRLKARNLKQGRRRGRRKERKSVFHTSHSPELRLLFIRALDTGFVPQNVSLQAALIPVPARVTRTTTSCQKNQTWGSRSVRSVLDLRQGDTFQWTTVSIYQEPVWKVQEQVQPQRSQQNQPIRAGLWSATNLTSLLQRDERMKKFKAKTSKTDF